MRKKIYPFYDVPTVNSLKELVDFAAEEYGDKKAFWYIKYKEEKVKSFIDLRNDIRALGTVLLKNGFENQHIALLGENSYEWVVSYFAVVNSGNVVVPLDKELDARSISTLADRSNCDLIIHSPAYSEEAECCGIKTLSMKKIPELIKEGEALFEEGDDTFDNVCIDENKTCAIVFTSGTTSMPKGVMLSQRNLATNAVACSKNVSIENGTVAILPFYHTFGFASCISSQLLRGYEVFINSSLKRVLDDIKYAKPAHLSVVPMLLKVIYDNIWTSVREQGKERLFKSMIKVGNGLDKVGLHYKRKMFAKVLEAFGGKLELIVTGGSAIDEKYISGFRDLGITVLNGYGITECSPIVSTVRNENYAPDSVGTVVSGADVRIVDGEIQVKGSGVFSGYYKDSKATENAFDNGWFKTGDLGRLDDDGFLYIEGRSKNLIILSNGKNVCPEEIETKLEQSIPEIKEVVVSAQDDMIVAEIFPVDNREEIIESIEKGIVGVNRTMPSFKKIAKTRYRDTEFPKTATKKIKRNYMG